MKGKVLKVLKTINKKTSNGTTVDFQLQMRLKSEPNLPDFLRGRTWIQPICSKVRVPVIVVKETGKIYKGPFNKNDKFHMSRINNITNRYQALTKCNVPTPYGRWIEYNNHLIFEAEYIKDMENCFHKDKTPDDILDDPDFIAGVVKMGIGKLCLRTLGDLCCRNSGWSPSMKIYFAFDLEDNIGKPVDVANCSIFELVFSPLTRCTKDKRERLISLMKKYKQEILKGLDQVNQYADPGFDANIFNTAVNRIKEM